MNSILGEFLLQRTADAAELSRRAQILAALAQLPPSRRNQLASAVDEVCRAITSRGGTAVVRFSLVQREGHRLVEVSIRDQRSTENHAGMGVDTASGRAGEPAAETCIQRAGELLDHFETSGWPLSGAVIRLGQACSPAFAAPSASEVSDWCQMLTANSPLDALAMALERSHSLAAALGNALDRESFLRQWGQRASTAEQMNMLALVVGKTKNAISIMNRDALITWVNNAFVQMTGYSLAEAVDRKYQELLFGPSTDPEVVQLFETSFRAGTELTRDVLQYRRDGQMIWSECNVMPVTDSAGELCHWIAISSDITRRRQTEEALRHAKELAEANSRAKSEFLANLSHEIRSPMNVILGMTDLALATELSPEQQGYLETIQSSADGLLQLLNDILDLSKIEAGKLQVEHIDFDLPQLIRDAVNALKGRALEKDLTLSAELPDDLPRFVRGDPVRLRQVLLNLISNAIKFTPQGTVTVVAQSPWQQDDDVGLHVQVRDTGIGIPADRLDKIFESFTQVDASTSRRFGGTGLGLTITAELVRLMRGRIWVQSSEEAGSIFHVAIPLKQGTPPAITDASQQSSPKHSPPASPSRPLCVLVADDHEPNRQLVTTILSKRGHQCVEAATGQEAIEISRREPLDVALMDIQMPDVDGFAVTAAIRQEEQKTGGHLPIIALTAHAMTGDEDKCLAAGMDAYLAKPLRPKELVTMVESMGKASTDETNAREKQVAESNEPLPFSFAVALDSLDNEEDLLAQQMQFFVNDGPKLIEQIRTAIADQDHRGLEVPAHRLKGLLARYAFHEASGLAYDLEQMGNQKAISDEAETKADQLAAMVNQLVAAIKNYLAL